MRHKTFTNETDAVQFAGEVQQAVYASEASLEAARAVLMVTGNIKIIPAFIGWMGKYCVPMPVEPLNLDETNVVDTIEPPVEQEGL